MRWTAMEVCLAVVTGLLLLRVGFFILSLALGILWNLLLLSLTLGMLWLAWGALQQFLK